MVFDLDPGDQAGILEMCPGGADPSDLLSRMGACKLCQDIRQERNLHVYVPLNRKETTFEIQDIFKGRGRNHAETLPGLGDRKNGEEKTGTRRFYQLVSNDASKTMICVYSLRARGKPTVRFRLNGDLENPTELGDPERFQVTHSEALSRPKKGDLFRELLVKETEASSFMTED